MSQTDRLRIIKGNNSISDLAPSLYFSIIHGHLVDKMRSQNIMKFQHCLLNLLRKIQNVAD